MRHLQRNQADWDIIGNIASIIDKNNFVIVRIASNIKTSRKGIMVDDPHFNTVYIYKEDTKKHILSEWEAGDLVHACGTFREQQMRDEDGHLRSYTQIKTDSIVRMAKKSQN